MFDGITVTAPSEELKTAPASWRTYHTYCRKTLEEWLNLWRPIHGSTETYEVERAASLAKFDEAQSAYDAKSEASGLAAAELQYSELYDALWEAEQTILKSQPRSAEGAIALLLFAAELAADSDLDKEWIMPAFVNAARAIAGPDEASKIVI